MVSDTINRLVKLGYKQDCDDLKALVTKRLNVNADKILKDYINSNRSYVDNYCSAHNIDQWVVMDNKEAMIDLGMALITTDIKHRTLRKADQDKELIELGIETISITNSIETKSKWMRFLGSPGNIQWLNRRAKAILSSSIKDKVRVEIDTAIEFLNENFIKPNILRPDTNKYWDIIEYPMTEECEAFLTFPSGN